MSTPEIPDFSAVPPSEQPPEQHRSEQVAHTPRRGGRSLAVAGFATAVVLGAVGTTAYLADQRAGSDDDVQLTSAQAGFHDTAQPSAPPQQGDRDGDGDRARGGWGRGPGMGHGGFGVGPRGALHGELVVPQRDGTGTQTIVVQSGSVTAVSATSLTVKSSDGFTATYVITSSTRVAPRSGAVTSLKKGDPVHVAATKSGSTLTALMVGTRPEGPPGRGKAPAPAPTSTSSSANGTSSTA